MTATSNKNNDSNFVNALENFNQTEKGATGFVSTHNPFVDGTFLVSSFRGEQKDFSKIDHLFEEMMTFCLTLAFRWLFWVGDIRQGFGERRLFRHLFDKFGRDELVGFIPEYHRWDFIPELDFKRFPSSATIIKRQWDEDLKGLENGSSISLLSKWLPSPNASSLKSKELSKKVRGLLGRIKEEDYRKTLSILRRKLKLVETMICSNQWSEIDYQAVPSKANLLYRNAFLKHDASRRKRFLDELEEGKVNINSSVNYPHEIVREYKKNESGVDKALEGLWKNLLQKSTPGNMLLVRDGSGSMLWGDGPVVPMHVADALTIFFSEHAENSYFKNKFLTFSRRCRFVELKSETLFGKLRELEKYDDCDTTNLESVFDTLLMTIEENNLSQEDIPSLLIISDMEFDESMDNSNSSSTLMRSISTKWAKKGYTLPKLIFWNVGSRSHTIPMIRNEEGLILISGYSQTIMDVILSGGDVSDAWTPILRILESERYAQICVDD